MRTRPRCHPTRRHHGRYLCSACFQAVTRMETRDEHPRVTRESEELVAEAELLRARLGEPVRGWDPVQGRQVTVAGATWPQIAARLGVEHKALERARHRVKTRTGAR
jgi:hypothetical protein